MVIDLGSRTSPVGQKVRDVFHGGTLDIDQVVTGPLENDIRKPRCSDEVARPPGTRLGRNKGDTAILLSRE